MRIINWELLYRDANITGDDIFCQVLYIRCSFPLHKKTILLEPQEGICTWDEFRCYGIFWIFEFRKKKREKVGSFGGVQAVFLLCITVNDFAQALLSSIEPDNKGATISGRKYHQLFASEVFGNGFVLLDFFFAVRIIVNMYV